MVEKSHIHLTFADELNIEIAAKEAECAALQAEIEELRLVRQYHLRMVGGDVAASELSSETDSEAPSLLETELKAKYSGPSEAVREFLRLNPDSSSAQVCDAVVGRFETSSNPRTIVYSTLASLESRKKATSRKVDGIKRFTLKSG